MTKNLIMPREDLTEHERMQLKICRGLVAPSLRALERAQLNHRHWKLACRLVDVSLACGRLWAWFSDQRQLGELFGYSDSTLCDVLNGYQDGQRWVKGLFELGIARRLDSASGLLVEFNPNHAAWTCGVMHSESDRARWRADVEAQSVDYARQLESPEIEERYSLAKLLSWQNAENALSLAAGGAAGFEDGQGMGVARPTEADPGVMSDALRVRAGMGMGVARPSCGAGASVRGDALRVDKVEDAPRQVRATSENPKCDLPPNAGDFGESEVNRTTTVKQLNREQNNRTVQQFNRSGRDDSNRLLRELAEQFARAHGAKETAAEMQRSGAHWRKVARAFPAELEREIASLHAHISEGKGFTRKAWFWMHYYLLQTIGAPSWSEAWKKSKESI